MHTTHTHAPPPPHTCTHKVEEGHFIIQEALDIKTKQYPKQSLQGIFTPTLANSFTISITVTKINKETMELTYMRNQNGSTSHIQQFISLIYNKYICLLHYGTVPKQNIFYPMKADLIAAK